MKILAWNARGCSRDGFLSQALFYDKHMHLDLFCFVDTRASADVAKTIADRLNFSNYSCVAATGQCGGLLLCWKSRTINIISIVKHDRFLHCCIFDDVLKLNWYLTLVYIYPQKEKQAALFQEILSFKPPNDEPWLLAGDFNNIMCLSEKLGGNCTTNRHMVRFQHFLNQGGLVSLDAIGVPFTWTNNHTDDSILFERLDRAVANPNWYTAFPNASLENLPIVGSDHGPICLSLRNKPSFSSFGFKFEAMWLRHPGFSNVVQGAWSNHVTGSPVQKFVTLCHSFKCLARTWNKNVFGDLFNKIKENQEDLQNIQSQLMVNPTDHYLSQRNMELTKISFDLHRSEEIYWAQKARANWLKLGDKNTRFFQMQASIRKKRNNISKIKDDCGNWISDMDAVADFFVQDFKKRFTPINYPSNHNLCSFLEAIDHCISPETNEQLIANVSRNEVFNAIASIGSIKAPGPDGIHAAFFQSYWKLETRFLILLTISFKIALRYLVLIILILY